MASGLDSLASVELQNVLQASYPVPLPATLALDYPSVTAIAGYIHSKLATAAGTVTATNATAARRVPGSLAAGTAVRSEPLGVFGMAFVLPAAAASAGSAGHVQGCDAIGVVPLER
jgi:hypothetical protein